MAFNWFRRQYDDSAKSQEQPTETPPPTSEIEEAETASTEASPAIAEDYLTWAKTAYKNIQQRQQVEVTTLAPAIAEVPISETPQATAVESAVVSQAPDVEDLLASETSTSTPETSEAIIDAVEAAANEPAISSQEDAIPSEIATSEVVVESAPEEVSKVDLVDVAPTSSSPASLDSTAAEETTAEESVKDGNTPLQPTSALASTFPEADQEPSAEVSPTPFWARAEAERLERLERLKASAIEEAEPEVAPSSAATSAGTPTDGTVETPAIAFDDGFLWSAEILAAQGRRPDQVSLEEITWLNRLRQGLDKTRRGLINQLKAIVGQGPLNQDAVTEIESLLLQADVGIEATDYIINALQSKLRQETLPPDEAIAYLKQILRNMLDNPAGKPHNPTFAPEKDTLNVWLITGVNGAGKTTTIGKIAHLAKKSDYNCLIAAADTFRAAAVEQVKVWGQRSQVEVIANPGKNTDPAAVVFDAIAAAESRNTELLLVDTAGRLQNKKNLMDELSKVRRIIDKKAPNATVESLLVLDATLGQNGLRQAEVFSEAAQLSGVVLTKLDGTAKGGIALAVVQQLGLPIRFIGAGEGIEDLRPFSSYEFVEALLAG